MDSDLRNAQRDYNLGPNVSTLINLLRAELRGGETIELTDTRINEHWDEDPLLREYLASLSKFDLRICDHELRRWAVTRTFLLNQLRGMIREDYEYMYTTLDINEVRDALGGEFSIMHTAFAPNGEGCGNFSIVTLFDNGFSEHIIEFECGWDWSQWEVNTVFIGTWGDFGLTYGDYCSDGAHSCEEEHLADGGNEEHISNIDMDRAALAEEHFTERMAKPLYLLDLNLRGY